MSRPAVSPPGAGVRLVVGASRSTRTDRTEGRTLFPSPSFSHWPPFETLAETTTVGGGPPDPHPHSREEVVNYVLSGSLEVCDAQRRCTEVSAGAASLLATMREEVHDVNASPGARAHWLSLVLRLPPGTPEPTAPHQHGPAVPIGGSSSRIGRANVVGERGPVRSVLGLEMQDVVFHEAAESAFPVEERRSALVYILSGSARAADRDLPAGSGLLAEGIPRIPISAEKGSRLILASVRREA